MRLKLPRPLRLFTLILTNLIILLSLGLQAQISQPNRFEIRKRASQNYWNVVSAHEFGIVLFRESTKIEDGNKVWEAIMLDTDLNQRWEKEYQVDRRLSFRGYDFSNNQLFLLFQSGPLERGEYTINRIQLSNGTSSEFSFTHAVPLELEDFLAVGESAVFGGYANGLPTVFIYNFSKDKFEVIPGFYKRNSYLLDISADEVNNNFSIVVSERYSPSQNSLTVKTFDTDGEILLDVTIPIEEDVNILSAKTTTFDLGTHVITGTFGERNSDFAKGVYFSKIQANKEPGIKKYNFTELGNYFNYLSGPQKERMDSRIEEYKKKGKELNVKSRIALHELIPEGDEYIMLGEVYDVSMGTMSNTPYGTPYYMNNFNSGFRGYRVALPDAQPVNRPASFEYKQAIIVGFTHDGDLKWDNSLQLEKLFAPYLNQIVHINTINNRSVLIYKEESTLIGIIFEKGGESSGLIEEEIKLKYDGDELRNEKRDFSGLSYWYEDNFFTWGYEKIRNKLNDEVSKRRDVFYINKIKIN